MTAFIREAFRIYPSEPYGSRLTAAYAAVLSSVCACGLPIVKYRLPQSRFCRTYARGLSIILLTYKKVFGIIKIY